MLKAQTLNGHAGIAHGFFTREGGVSDGIYASLNCGAGSDDRPEYVLENKRRAAAALGFGEDALTTLYQVHSADVVTVGNPASIRANPPKADGMATDRPGVILGILTADCAPVLFADPANRVIGAAHAGWRGALSGVVETTVRAMETLGAKRTSIAAAIGPCIAQTSYQVGRDFPNAFLADEPANGAFFAPDPEECGKHRFDLRGYVLSRLEAAGIAAADALDIDTYEEDGYFFSYRRTCHRGETDYGRGLSGIALLAD